MITSIHNACIKDVMKLKQKKYRNQTKQYLVEGHHLVQEALQKDKVAYILSTEELQIHVKVILVSEAVMKKLTDVMHPQTIMAVCHMDIDDTIIVGDRYLLLDTLQDPGNVGTLIRTAAAFGIDQVILSPTCVDIYNDKVLRAMQGAHFHISCVYQDLMQCIPYLQQQGIFVVGSALQGARAIETIEPSQRMAFVVGNEANGMLEQHRKVCDALAYIPIRDMESLNVAIAGSIMMYHFKK